MSCFRLDRLTCTRGIGFDRKPRKSGYSTGTSRHSCENVDSVNAGGGPGAIDQALNAKNVLVL